MYFIKIEYFIIYYIINYKIMETQRKKKANKQKRTFELFGKNTTKGLRIKQTKVENQQKKKCKNENSKKPK